MKRKISILPLAVFAALLFALNFYALSGVKVILDYSLTGVIFWSFLSVILLALVYSIFKMRDNGMDLLFKISTHAFLVFLASELVFIVFLLAGDIFSLVSGHRSFYWIEFSAALFLLTVIVFIYGMVRGKYAYRVIKHVLYFDDLPSNFDGFTITQISDVHAGSFNNPKAVQKGIDLIKQQKSDLFVFTGDLVNNKAEEIKPWIDVFKQVKAPYGQFSILGNHDYGDYVKWPTETEKSQNLDQLKAYHAELGYRLLLDEHVEIHKDGQKIILAGVENWGVGFGERGDLKKSLANTNADDFKVLLSHDPTHWQAEVTKFASKIHLTLSGHTHGMQFGLEAFGIKWSPVKYRYAHWAGITSENGRFLNINRGFGFLGFSGRVGIWPEITVIELKRTAGIS
ncbi:metallophosphoesterase [Pedobacter metabolipauper]|uniref:Calcineurin-like phosphoesterase domain-containing protein n=1 Tax=Pedobacter metabolipauper TaxID=425513 RepID=A0A4R6SSU6_9SPHI|nr:metallophosphoesterase [Pedobacter metabolipauper]TDQ08377.1 hypothetical protein ATK78_2889 [Pedobacter metabolipauper]